MADKTVLDMAAAASRRARDKADADAYLARKPASTSPTDVTEFRIATLRESVEREEQALAYQGSAKFQAAIAREAANPANGVTDPEGYIARTKQSTREQLEIARVELAVWEHYKATELEVRP